MEFPLQKSDEEIIADIRAKYEHYMYWANKYKAMLDAYDGPVQEPSHKKSSVQHMTVSLNGGKADLLKGSIADKLRSIGKEYLESKNELTPLSEIFDHYGKLSNDVTDRQIFGVRMAQQKTKGYFKSIEIRELPIESRFLWGLPEWFQGDKVKPEYYEKLKRKYRLSEPLIFR